MVDFDFDLLDRTDCGTGAWAWPDNWVRDTTDGWMADGRDDWTEDSWTNNWTGMHKRTGIKTTRGIGMGTVIGKGADKELEVTKTIKVTGTEIGTGDWWHSRQTNWRVVYGLDRDLGGQPVRKLEGQLSASWAAARARTATSGGIRLGMGSKRAGPNTCPAACPGQDHQIIHVSRT